MIVPYDSGWKDYFEEEFSRIQCFTGSNLKALYHVGSTSVPGLSAKPIIDIILVTNDIRVTKSFLTSKNLGYRYKGEYNIPLRDLYGKKGKYEIYLHVHKCGSSEILLNLMFRNFLINNPDSRLEYEKVKIRASVDKAAMEVVSTGITKYNLMKNDFIVSILKQCEFSCLCVRFVTQNSEEYAFQNFKRTFFKLGNIVIDKDFKADNIKKFILYRGTEIVGASELLDIGCGRFFVQFMLCQKEDEYSYLLKTIETWVKERTDFKHLFGFSLVAQISFYAGAGFSVVNGNSFSVIKMYKNLSFEISNQFYKNTISYGCREF